MNSFDKISAAVVGYALFTLDPTGIVRDWNAGAERIKQYRAGEIIGSHFSRFYLPEDLANKLPQRELEIAAHEGHFNGEGWRIRKDGSRFWADVTISAIRDDDATLTGFLMITRDLTKRRLASEAFRQSEEKFRLLLESVVEYAIFMLDAEGHVVSWNAGARRLKGYEENEILGKHFSVFYPLETRSTHPRAMLRRALTEGSAETEGWRVRKDGSRFWGNIVITPLYDPSGELQGFAKITRDLTERRKVERLQESERQRNVFLATLAHELRTPLAPILFGVDVILKSGGNSDSVAEVAPMLQRQIGQMSRLIDDLLDMSRVSSGKISLKKSRVPLKDVFESAVESVASTAASAGHELTVLLADNSLEVEVDPQRISQVISNLLSNAIKFTSPGGNIVLEGAVEGFDSIRISVSDNGKGVPLEAQERIFELFEQGTSGAAAGGLGIGLTLVKSLVEMHGGSVSMFSAGENKGTEFHLLLPVLVRSENPSADESVSQLPTSESGRLPRVLVADDGRNAADILGMFFRIEGMDAAVAYDGAQAVETAREFRPELVFLDLGMPVMDGYEAARKIRLMDDDVFLVALSGWGDSDDRRRTKEAGFDLHLVKPVLPDDLREIIAHYREVRLK